ncbi:Serine/threonine protein kinase [Dorcoceras hygrometricum]|uniref:Serine/threonine protein kinase n=1 Tax=Dorcoceras hygrometricum TaxID=472368 RepID=A0A2Z7AGZ2_9LAMI|nr:Serine/threonine protein kinase [Dorcoceras hygrometricum]
MGVTTDFGMGQTDVNELSLVNSAVNEVIDEAADTYRELSCWACNPLLRVISCWYVGCDDQQRALIDSEATTFCEQEPAVAVERSHALRLLVCGLAIGSEVFQVIPLAVAVRTRANFSRLQHNKAHNHGSTQTTQKQENKYDVKPQYEELSKQLIMQHAIINAMKCIRAIKGRIARSVNQLANHLNRASITRTVYQPGKSSVRDLQSLSAHHRSVVFRHNQSVGHHSDDSVGLFRHNSSVGQSQRGSQIRGISADFTTSITAMFTLKAVKSAQFVPPTADFYLNRYNKERQFQPAPTSFHLAPSSTAEAILNLKSVKETHTQFICSSNLNFNT